MLVTRSTNRIRTALSSSGCQLRVLHGPESGTEALIPAAGVVVGADASADVQLTDSAVSRRHCSIVPARDGFDVTDLGSRNGTYVDGVSIKRATLPVGTVLRVGGSLLQLVPAEEELHIPPSSRTSFGGMVGKSAAMRQVYALLERASASRASILLLGESGTGKELAARAVHDHSPRRGGPFVVFDCGASTDTLIESDLFGHVKGAFTGAHGDRPGAFERAHEGTLFLDEIGDLPLPLQPKLLRLLETGEVTPLGSRRTERFDVRVVAATHRDLDEEVARGTFRGDLYYRLAVVEVYLPPLRQRLDDVETLVSLFLEREGRTRPGTVRGANLDKLLGYGFPGNVRELRNIVTRAIALSPPDAPFSEMPMLLRGALARGGSGLDPLCARADRPFQEAKAELLARFEREYLGDLMQRSSGNVSHASRGSGIERKHLYRLLRKAGLLPPAAARAGAEGDAEADGEEPDAVQGDD
jgi:DNA-binding NtrC family response regulator